MKTKFFTPILLITFSATALCCQSKNKTSRRKRHSNRKQRSSVTAFVSAKARTYQGGILIANFGTEQLNPLNTEGRGYIAYHKDNRTEILIPADGNLSGPKGMFVRDEHLFICDVNKIVVYNLQAPEKAPQVVLLPEGNLFVNDLVAEGNTLYASVTNTGKIFSIDISDPGAVGIPAEWVSIAGPNGLIIENGTMYVASYPADGKTTDNNVIYQITDLSKPVPEKFITTPGQYDGIALSADKKTMYITNWTPAQVCAVDMNTRKITPLDISRETAVRPGRYHGSLRNDVYSDLPNSGVIVYQCKIRFIIRHYYTKNSPLSQLFPSIEKVEIRESSVYRKAVFGMIILSGTPFREPPINGLYNPALTAPASLPRTRRWCRPSLPAG